MSVDFGNIQNTARVPGIVILTHGRAGEELIRSAEMIVGKMEKVMAVSLETGDDPSDYRKKVSAVLDQMPRGSIIMTDLFGGTPSNTAAVLSRDYAVSVISGLNLPMLIEAVNLRETLSGEELARVVEAEGKNGVRNILEALIK